jgi:cephalosporin-C deacetylase-like acetyl esterase
MLPVVSRTNTTSMRFAAAGASFGGGATTALVALPRIVGYTNTVPTVASTKPVMRMFVFMSKLLVEVMKVVKLPK